MYGESVFTTMRMVNGTICDWDHHFERLRRGVEYVYGPFTEGEDWLAIFKDRLETRCQQESGDKILRLTVYRDGQRGAFRSAIFSITDLRIHLLATAFDPLLTDQRTMSLRTCAADMKPLWWPSFLKAGNYLNTILAQKNFLGPDDDDLLFLAPDDSVLESSVANIFVVRHNKIYTPVAGPNVLEGVMRKKVLAVAHEFFDEVSECPTSLEQLMKGDLVFGSNSIRGLFLISRVDEKIYEPDEELMGKFNRLRMKVME